MLVACWWCHVWTSPDCCDLLWSEMPPYVCSLASWSWAACLLTWMCWTSWAAAWRQATLQHAACSASTAAGSTPPPELRRPAGQTSDLYESVMSWYIGGLQLMIILIIEQSVFLINLEKPLHIHPLHVGSVTRLWASSASCFLTVCFCVSGCAASCRRRHWGGRALSRSVRAGCRSCRGWRTGWL